VVHRKRLRVVYVIADLRVERSTVYRSERGRRLADFRGC